MFGLEGILASAVIPAGVDLIKSIFGGLGRKWAGLSVDDEIKLEQSIISRLEAIAKLDNPHGTPSQWVVDLRASFRYIVAGFLVVTGAGTIAAGLFMKNQETIMLGFNLAGMPWSFIFGERMWNGFKGMQAK